MMEPKTGSFAWLELATTDRNAAKNFYSNLFGWAGEDISMSPEMTYTIFRIGGKDVGGAYALMKDQLDQHVPPHWMFYVKVGSADQSAARAVKLGAKQIVAPTDIPNVGRFAVIQDPAGAVISLLQPSVHSGFTTFGDINALCWADLNTHEPEKAAKFYSDWFGWTYDTDKDGYRHIINGTGNENMIGGIPPGTQASAGTPSHWMAYFNVVDCNATAAKAAQFGAKTLMPATPMPDVGTIAVLADPQGAVFALYQHAPRKS